MAKLELDGMQYDLPVVVGSEGEHAVDISALRDKTGYITLDDGYGNTGSCKSKITFIDGERGILRYRGIPIEELAERSTFVEAVYLLIWGTRAPLLAGLRRKRLQHLLALALVGFQFFLFRLADGLQLRQLGGFLRGSLLQHRQPRKLTAQRFYRRLLCARKMGQIAQITCALVGIGAIEKQLQCIALPSLVRASKRLGETTLLLADTG